MNFMDKSIKNILSNNITIVVVGVCTILSVVMACLSVPNDQLSDLLKNVASLNITLAIGLGTISISLKNEERTQMFLKEIIAIMLMSLLSYFLPFWADYFIMRLYLFVIAFSSASILISTARQIEELKKENK